MEIKKRLFGGYKKSSVDAAINELNQKIEEAEANSKTLQHEIEIKDSKISDYMKRNEELKLENETLKSEKSENNLIFKNLAKIYQHAFEAGNQIVCEAKETAASLIEDINVQMDEMMQYSHAVISDYDNIHQETDELLSSLNNDISKVRQNVFTSINKAKTLTDMYSRMQDTAHTASGKINKALDEYKVQSSAFLTESISENDEKAEKKDTEIKAEHAPELFTVQHPQIFKVISNPAEKETVPTVSENEVQPTLSASDEVQSSIPASDEVSTETIAPASAAITEEIPVENTVEQADVSKVEQADVSKVEQADISEVEQTAKDIPSQPEQPAVSTVTENSTPDFGFTQFGRKSKLTAQERNEFIRKALLKNGG